MSDTLTENVIHPLSASEDGTRNAFSLRCDVTGQAANYAACLWRLRVLAAPDIRTPADWAQCGTATACGRCKATEMRREEELKGCSIYFRDRTVLQRIASAARQWLMPSTPAPSTTKPTRSTPPSPASFVDVVKSADYAEAINAMSPVDTAPVGRIDKPAHIDNAECTVNTSSTANTVIAVNTANTTKLAQQPPMLPGESPLAYARRIRSSL